MPICRTCRGEYTDGESRCPRCKSDVTAWEQESFPLVEFIRRGGILALLPSMAAILAWFVFWHPQGASLHHPLLALVSFALSQAVIILLYATRLSWRERKWASEIYGATSASLTMEIARTFIVGLVLAVISFSLYKLWKPPFVYLKQLIFAFAYVPTYVCFTVSLTLVAIQDYLHRLDQRVPPPIFAHTERLVRVAVETGMQSMGVQGDSKARGVLGRGGPSRDYEIIEIDRVPETGGIHVLLRVHQRPFLPGDRTSNDAQWIEKRWRIEADRWGRVQSVKPSGNKSG